ncbi:protein kinase domain-containing protein [Streptomyces sp. enrichment culture]|uniref:serine/threonine-protein kinase n=1 Tax=Streptomyces sp. enrichment culture TaxID=1795815 RepID=UPI003F56CD8D
MVVDVPGERRRAVLRALPDRAPRRVGPYRILARLGAGGMGEVYLGADTRSGTGHDDVGPQLAAVKTVRPELVGDGAFRDRFRREMDTARAVESRFTARLLAGDAEAAQPWLATEYVAGPTLERAVREAGPLPVETVRALGLDLVRGLSGIHHARVQHRDLKPSNVLIGRNSAKVIDFGIARAFGADTMTATGAVIGSPGHMSPEHVLGGRHVVAASDVFCLASLLCYAATGRSPFGDGPLAAVLYRISQAEADLSEVPADVRELIEDCLSRDPAHRPDTAALEGRFRAAAGAGETEGTEAGWAVWPPVVRESVAAHEAEVAAAVAAAGPLATPVPTMPGASPVHSAETVTRPPDRDPAAAPPGGLPSGARTGGRRRTVVAVVATAVAVGVLGAVGLRTLQNGGGDEDRSAGTGSGTSTGPSASPSAGTVADGTGLDRLGVERSRYFPADPASRPDGWKPWSGRLTERPWSCALSSEVLVCRTLDGGLEAVRPSDGKPLWKAASPSPRGRAMSSNRGVVLPGRGTGPLIQGGTVVTLEAGVVRGRSATDGTVRWESDTGAGEEVEVHGDPLLGDGAAFFTLGGAGSIYAVDVSSGKRLWTAELAAHDPATAGYGMQRAEIFVEGRLIALTDGGLVAFDARSGKRTPVPVRGDNGCTAMRSHGGQVYCDIEGQDTVTLDAVTLREVPPDEDPQARAPQAAGVVAAAGREYALGPGDSGGTVELVDLSATDAAGRAPRTVGAPAGPEPDEAENAKAGALHSEPVIVGPTALFADNRALHTLPLRGGKSVRHAIEGAPGNRPPGGADAKDPGDFEDVQNKVWAPEVISLGGVLYLVFHDGTVRSLELPG